MIREKIIGLTTGCIVGLALVGMGYAIGNIDNTLMYHKGYFDGRRDAVEEMNRMLKRDFEEDIRDEPDSVKEGLPEYIV